MALPVLRSEVLIWLDNRQSLTLVGCQLRWSASGVFVLSHRLHDDILLLLFDSVNEAVSEMLVLINRCGCVSCWSRSRTSCATRMCPLLVSAKQLLLSLKVVLLQLERPLDDAADSR